MLRAVKVLYGGFDNWEVKGIRNLRQGVPSGGLTVEVVILNTDTSRVLRLEGVWDGEEWVDRILSEDADSDRADAAKKGKGRAKPNCKKGRPCGGSCISRAKQCRIQPEGVAKEALNRAAIIPDRGELVKMNRIGSGAFGVVAASPDGDTAYKYTKEQGKSFYPEEIRILKTASDAGVGPRFFGAAKDNSIIAMEYLRGYKTIEGEDFKGLPMAEQKRIAKNVVAQTRAMHSAGIVHQDYHGGNIMFAPSTSDVRVIDFGLAGVRKTVAPESKMRDFETLTYFAELSRVPVIGESMRAGLVRYRAEKRTDDIYDYLVEAIDNV